MRTNASSWSVVAALAVAAFGPATGWAKGPGAQIEVGADLYRAGGEVEQTQDVRGDLVASGGDLRVSGKVGGDAAIAGGSVRIEGGVGDDLRAAGGRVTIAGPVGDHLVAMGGLVQLLPGARVGGDAMVSGGQVVIEGPVEGDLIIAGGSVRLDGTIGGAVKVTCGELEVGDHAVIAGGLVYVSPDPASVSSRAQISGPIRHIQKGRGGRGVFMGMFAGFQLFKLLALLLAGLLTVVLLPRFTQRVAGDSVARFGWDLLVGLALLVMIPCVAIVLLITLVGIPIAALLTLAYFGFLVLSKILSGIVAGALLWRLFSKAKQAKVTWQTALVGILVLSVFDWVPLLGWMVPLGFVLVTFGSLATLAFLGVARNRRATGTQPA